MKKHFRTFAVLPCLTAAAGIGSQFAFAETTSPREQSEVSERQQQRRGHHKQKFMKRIAKELGLTDQQKTKGTAIYEKYREENKDAISQLRMERRQMRALVQSGSADETAIRAQAAKVAELEADLAVKKAQSAREFLALLTPDQATKFKAMQAKWEKKSKRVKCCDDGPIK